jgi:hypothetical protein
VSAPKAKAGCGYLFMGTVVAIGLMMTMVGVSPAPDSEFTGRLVLTALGLCVVIGGILFLIPMRRALARQAAQEKLEADFPNQPWKWRPEWNSGRIEATGGKAALAMWFFALLWNAISWTSVFAAWPQLGRGEKAFWLVFLFPLVGLLVLWAAIYQTIRARKFGQPVFLPTGVPGVIGGYLGGVIHVPSTVQAETDVSLALQACRTTVTGSGKNRSVQTDVLWEHEVRIARENLAAGTSGTDIPVLFHIPAGQPDSELKTSDPRTYWRLTAKAAVPGVDFESTFEVPVFTTGETVAAPEPDKPLLAEYRENTATPEALATAGIMVLPAGSGGHPAIAFSSRHIRGTKIVMTALALAASVGVVVLFAFGLWVPALIVGFFDLIFLLIAYSVWTGDTEVEVQPGEVVVRSKKLGGWREQRLPRDQIALVRTEKSMRSGETQYYKLVLVGQAGADANQAVAGEPFALRKIRYQLERARKNPGTPVAGQGTKELIASLRSQPRFQLTAANNVPGPALAESVTRMLEERIGISR